MGASVNDGIDPKLLVYTSFDTAVEWFQHFGKGVLLAKMNIKAPFCFLGCFFFVHR